MGGFSTNNPGPYSPCLLVQATYYSQQDSYKPLNETVLANFTKLRPDAALPASRGL